MFNGTPYDARRYGWNRWRREGISMSVWHEPHLNKWAVRPTSEGPPGFQWRLDVRYPIDLTKLNNEPN